LNNASIHSEDNLLKDLRAGSLEAYNHIFKLYWKTLYRVANGKLRSKLEAEEVVQELFIALWEKRETLLIGNLSIYLNTAVRNRVISRIRTKLREQKHWHYYYSFFPTTDEGTEQSVMLGDLNKTLNDILQKLPIKTRQVFEANWFDGKSMAEVSNQLNISEKNAEYHLTKSLKSIRGHLKKRIISIALLIVFLF